MIVAQIVNLNTFESVAKAARVQPLREYSGKGMMGVVCAAVAGQELDLAQFVIAATERLPLDDPAEWAARVRKDTLGRRQVWYWPGINTSE